MYGSSCKSGSPIRDSNSTRHEILVSGPNHTVDTTVLVLLRASHGMVNVLVLTVNDCRYFLQQNAAIKYGTVTGVPINLKVLGIGNGLTVRCSCVPYWLMQCSYRFRTRSRNTLAISHMLSRIRITRWLIAQ
jgi:hypothetical protein